MINFKHHRPRYGLYFLLSLFCGAIATLDIYAGSQISPWALYMIPVALGGWLGGLGVGLYISFLAGGLIFLSAFIDGQPLQSWFYFALSVGNRIISFFVVAFLSSYLWEALDYLRKFTDNEKI
jgi:hypothetical protein